MKGVKIVSVLKIGPKKKEKEMKEKSHLAELSYCEGKESIVGKIDSSILLHNVSSERKRIFCRNPKSDMM